MKIAILGSGYVGLVTGACLSDVGNKVSIYDIDFSKIEMLRNAKVPFYEPGLQELIVKNKKNKCLKLTKSLKSAVRGAKLIFICVGTPQNSNGSANLSYVYTAVESVSQLMGRTSYIVIKSTVPVGTAKKAEKIAQIHLKRKRSVIISNPEFLKEGSAVKDFKYPDRVVIGTFDDKAKSLMSKLYSPFLRTGKPIFFMSNASAEISKYASNCMLATRISLMNEIARICEATGADVDSVRLSTGSDARIGKSFLFPGVGYGGSCFPKDVRALIYTGKEYNIQMDLLNIVDRVNVSQVHHFLEKIRKFYDKCNLEGKTFAIWGLSFKPNTDDVREAPSHHLIDHLLNQGAKIKAYDPKAAERTREVFGEKVDIKKDKYECCLGSDGLIVMTEWEEFRNPEFKKIAEMLKTPVVFDGRNIFDKNILSEIGLHYIGVGS